MTVTDPRTPQTADSTAFRMRVAAASTRLFAEQGYDATTVDEVAAAAGTSRRTLFRHFRSKEDLAFVDHESLLERVEDLLDDSDSDPWWTVCEAAEMVFAHYATHKDLARRRYVIVSQTPALRDRELITAYRYQRLFEEHLRARLPEVPRVRIIAFASAVTGVHNYLLRSMLRGDEGATAQRLDEELKTLCNSGPDNTHGTQCQEE
ncbi:TetR/AcrR family transcriptional regulator [Gordonia sp. (in: high G+C Gram-positive bacteria)]|uniref:TetR/AcrR family transcriptional regulator n=1 Tax=Gordonia sp. (in: high G+C Gram-positive bacteria) TaxID=84139 RepID=UPI0039E5C510